MWINLGNGQKQNFGVRSLEFNPSFTLIRFKCSAAMSDGSFISDSTNEKHFCLHSSSTAGVAARWKDWPFEAGLLLI